MIEQHSQIARVAETVEKWLLAYCKFFRQVEAGVGQLFYVDVLKCEDSNALHESIGAVNVPDPNIFHV
jgi:hypothetical protein